MTVHESVENVYDAMMHGTGSWPMILTRWDTGHRPVMMTKCGTGFQPLILKDEAAGARILSRTHVFGNPFPLTDGGTGRRIGILHKRRDEIGISSQHACGTGFQPVVLTKCGIGFQPVILTTCGTGHRLVMLTKCGTGFQPVIPITCGIGFQPMSQRQTSAAACNQHAVRV